ncbi:MAG: hypothetical protein ABSA63_08060 [Thermoplasmata archaeon]|jgi:hypothetical protein
MGGIGLAGVLVVAAVVIAAVALSGTVLLSNNGGSTAGAYVESSTVTLATAQSFMALTAGGPWNLVAISGIDFTQAYSNDTEPTIAGNCTFTDFSGITIPGFTGNYSNGQLENWVFEYVNSAGNSAVYLLVQGSQAKIVYELGGPDCSFGKVTSTPLPSDLIDSTQAAIALLSTTNASTFVQDNPSANAEFTLFPFFLLGAGGGLEWTVVFTTCDLVNASSGPAQGSFLYGSVNATTGTVEGTTYTASQGCGFQTPPPSKIPIGTALAVGNPVLSTCAIGSTFTVNGCTAGDYTYTLTVESSTVELGDMVFEVETATGGLYSLASPGGFSVISITGSVDAEYPLGSLNFMDMSSPFLFYGSGITNTTALTSIDTILIDMGNTDPAGIGLTFVVQGTNGYSGSIALALP